MLALGEAVKECLESNARSKNSALEKEAKRRR